MHVHGHGTGRLSKHRRVELSDKEENLRFDTDDGDAIDGVTEDEEGEEAEGGSEEERQRARWRESALYREAQRHAGAPSARKTHRLIGLRGLPTDVEHLRNFVIPQWALPFGSSLGATGAGGAGRDHSSLGLGLGEGA